MELTDAQVQEINDYIRKYAKKHNITEEQAKEHLMVKLFKKWKGDTYGFK